MKTQRDKTNRTKKRIKLLTSALQQKQAETAALKLETFEEKCSSFEISDMQKIAMRKIIAAANTRQKGRRYSEK